MDRAALFYHVSVSDKGGTVLWDNTRSPLVPVHRQARLEPRTGAGEISWARPGAIFVSEMKQESGYDTGKSIPDRR